MNSYKKAFTFVELIISISILILISVIAITSLNSHSQKVNNTKIKSDSITLQNALLNYNQENKTFPNPNGNKNYFKNDSSYGHSGDINNFGVYGSITEKTLPKKYIDNLPLDPVTNQYYSYGKTLDNKYFEIATILRNSEYVQTKLQGTYPGEFGPISLIREYNGSFFVSDQSKTHLPYNPDQHILIAKDQDGNIYYQGSKITNTPKTLTLYFSDGSISELQTGSTLKFSELKFNTKENNLLTTVKLFLSSGEIFTKATSLNPNGSEFQIYTSDTTAAVRGTIFGVTKNNSGTQIYVLEGKIGIYPQIASGNIQTNQIYNTTPLKIIRDGESLDINSNTGPSTPLSITNIDPNKKIKLEKIKNEHNIKNKKRKKVNYIPTISQMELFATADYKKPGDLFFKDKDGQKLQNQDYNLSGTIINRGLITIKNSDFINYSGSDLELKENFVLEFGVRGEDLRRKRGNYYLFNDSDNFLKLNLYNGILQFTDTSSTYFGIKMNIDRNKIDKYSFYRIIAIKNSKNLELKIKKYNGDLIQKKRGHLNGNINLNGNKIYVGSKTALSPSSAQKQWNGIIDYVKLYKPQS